MLSQTINLLERDPWSGDLHPLAEQLGMPDGLAAPTPLWRADFSGAMRDLPSLRAFLTAYQTRLLAPVELPTIVRAYGHASRFEVRELLELDRRLTSDPGLRSFAVASQHVGRRQLKRLRPLRDQRLVQRYLQAVEKGEAHAWHTVVYGLVLALYSLPLRQGLAGYARQTLRGFIYAAGTSLELRVEQGEELLALCGRGPSPAIEAAVATGFGNQGRLPSPP